MAEAPADAKTETKDNGVSREELLGKLKGMGKQGFKMGLKALVVCPLIAGGGLLLGGAAAGIAATALGWSTLAFLGAMVAGAAAGGVAGWFGAKMYAAGLVEDFAVSNGLELGQMGLRELLSLIGKAKKAAPAIKKPLEALEGAGKLAGKGLGKLGNWFGNAAEKPANDNPAVAQAPAPKEQKPGA